MNLIKKLNWKKLLVNVDNLVNLDNLDNLVTWVNLFYFVNFAPLWNCSKQFKQLNFVWNCSTLFNLRSYAQILCLFFIKHFFIKFFVSSNFFSSTKMLSSKIIHPIVSDWVDWAKSSPNTATCAVHQLLGWLERQSGIGVAGQYKCPHIRLILCCL